MADLVYERPLTYAPPDPAEEAALDAFAAEYHRERAPFTRRLTADGKHVLLRAYARAHGLTRFVETGTHDGECLAAMLVYPSPFKSAVSCELGDEVNPGTRFPTLLQRRFADEDRVLLHFGDSAKELPKMIDHFGGPALFWLDAHANGPGRHCPPHHFPLRDELVTCFGRLSRAGSVVLVDDMRFSGLGHWPEWRTIQSYGKGGFVEDDIARLFVI